MIHITPHIAIEEHEIEFSHIRASGPGGQNVNKVASAVQLRFNAEASPGLDDPTRARLRRLAGRRMTSAGVIVIDARRFRSQERNRQDAMSRLEELLRTAARTPNRRRPTKPSAGARFRRQQSKQQRATLKRTRRRVSDDD